MKYLIIILLLVSTSVHAQECKYRANKVSGMEGTRLIITEPQSLSSKFENGTVKVWSTISGDTSLIVAFVIELKEEFLLNKGDSILARLDNDEIVGLVLMQNSVMKDNGKSKSLTAVTAVDKDAIEKFQSHLMTEIMIDFGENRKKGFTNKKGESKAIRTIINCVVRYLQ